MARIPVGDRAREPPVGEWEEVPVRVVVMDEQVGRAVKPHAHEERQPPPGAEAECEEQPQRDQRERVEDVEEELPRRLEVGRGPDGALGQAQDSAGREVEHEDREVGQQAAQQDRKPVEPRPVPTQRHQVEHHVGRRVHCALRSPGSFGGGSKPSRSADRAARDPDQEPDDERAENTRCDQPTHPGGRLLEAASQDG